jgi:ring-1,2-phenylacetyl-CoA epoxidase subunit PaaD
MAPERSRANAAMDENAGRPVDDEEVACPYCGGTDTHVENARGPSLCRTIYHCETCDSPFERFG